MGQLSFNLFGRFHFNHWTDNEINQTMCRPTCICMIKTTRFLQAKYTHYQMKKKNIYLLPISFLRENTFLPLNIVKL